MKRTKSRYFAFFAGILLTCSACGGGTGEDEDDNEDDPKREEVLRTMTQALSNTEVAFGMSKADLGPFLIDNISNGILNLVGHMVQGPNVQPVGYDFGATPTPKNPTIDRDLSHESVQNTSKGAAGVGQESLRNTGIPNGPPGSLTEFSRLVCEYAEHSCAYIMTCDDGQQYACGNNYSLSGCTSRMEKGFSSYGFTSVSNIILKGMRCLNEHFSQSDCKKQLPAVIQDVMKDCLP